MVFIRRDSLDTGLMGLSEFSIGKKASRRQEQHDRMNEYRCF